MHKGAPPENFAKAKVLRERMTSLENKLWERIKDNQLGVNFRRQHPIHIYIVDFYFHKLKLIIELVGEYHNSTEQKNKDSERSKLLEFQDLSILRFSNKKVLEGIEGVLNKI